MANTDPTISAVGSRSRPRAEQFAARHGIRGVADSYEELVSRADVDIVYGAAPHRQHHALAMLAIATGKHVLVEKLIEISAREAEELAGAAQAAGVFAAEAMWTRYLPQFDVLAQVLDRGDLGEVRLATADVGWQVAPDAPPRFFDREKGGGAALDMGVYGYWFAHFAIGQAETVRALVQTHAPPGSTSSPSSRLRAPAVARRA
nr:Gfo/Idh/MocA family oxidoreductase [Microlunatus antarcticus]